MITVRRKPRISDESIQRLRAQAEDLDKARAPLKDRWIDAAEQFAPSLTNWDDQSPEIEPPAVKDLYDNTGYKASNLLTDGIQGYSFSRRDPWRRLTLDDEKLMESEPVAEWLQLFERHTFRQYARSNFYDEGRLFTKMAADFGTGIMLAREDWSRGVTHFETLHLRDCLIDDDPFGRPQVLFYTIWLRADQAARRWGKDNLPEQIQRAYDDGSRVYFKFKIIIMPRDQYDLDIGQRETRGHAIYTLVVAEVDWSKPIHEGGSEKLPFFVWRWARDLNGGPYGTDSPGLIEVSNARQLNGMAGDYARIVERLARPPIKATEGLRARGGPDLRPNGVTYLPYGEDFTAAMTVGNVQGVAELMERLRVGLKESYHVDFFLILTQAIDQQKTATEVAGVQGEKAALMASFFGRMAYEFLEPVDDYLTYHELMSGRFPVPPPEELKGREIVPQMTSPLAMMQKRFLTLEPTKQALSEILPLMQVAPEVKDNLDLDRFSRIVSEDYNMDRRVLLDIADVERTRKARAEQIMAERQLQQAQMVAGTQKDAAQARATMAEAQR